MRRKTTHYRSGLSFCLLLALFAALAPSLSQGQTDADQGETAPPPIESEKTTTDAEAAQAQPPKQGEKAPKVWNSQASPRDTMFTFLDGMNKFRNQGDQSGWKKVQDCFDHGRLAGLSDEESKNLLAAASRILEVLDKLGTIKPSDLPGKKEVANTTSIRYTFFPIASRHEWVYEELKAFGKWPAGTIAFEKSGPDRWVFSFETVLTAHLLAESLAPLPPRHEAPISDDAETDNIVGKLGPTFERTALWQWGVLLVAIFAGLVCGKLTSVSLRGAATRLDKREWEVRAAIFNDLASPASLALLSVGLMIGLGFVHMSEPVREFSNRVVLFLFVFAFGWWCYNLIDVVEIMLIRLTSKTETKLDDMVVPLIRKTLRIFLVIVYSLFVAQNIFGANITGWLAGLGIAGLAVSLAAQDSVKNLFGSLTVFFDRPFFVEDRIKFGGYDGVVEEIGFRSTRIRTLDGHLVSVPNMKFIDNEVENVAARPYIKRVMNITITYDTSPEKIDEALQIVKDIINKPEYTEAFDMEDRPPRVYFNDLNADSLNIILIYWYMLDEEAERDWFGSLAFAEKFNTELFVKYGDAGIEFAFPTQTLYLAGDPARQLNVKMIGGNGDGKAYT